ncbi:MAG: 30S ribosomal protein S2 [Gemmatimonadales bacterium]|nr:MAG: 30S ribosomal protein S2 [Gemmatimonadales bacterium]
MEEQQEFEQVGLNHLLEAGVHFGHQTRRWNPKMRKYIFTERNGIHIIDLRKTLDRLRAAETVAKKVVLKGERVLFVCTKPQLRGIIEEEADRCGAFYVTERWLGGMLTNYQTIRQQIRRLKELERGQEENAFEFYTKKEQLLIDRERAKLSKYFSGVKDMGRLPGAMFVVDAKREVIAVKEANRLGIPVIAITDTNADPDRIDYPIPGNDDAIRSVSLISGAIGDAILSARREVPEEDRKRQVEAEATTYSTETGEKSAASDDVAKRRLRRRRKPRPEIIASIKKGADAGEAEEQDAEPKSSEDDAPPAAAASDEATEKVKAKAETADAATDKAETAPDEGVATDEKKQDEEAAEKA